jgi:hypothetical protein
LIRINDDPWALFLLLILSTTAPVVDAPRLGAQETIRHPRDAFLPRPP